MGKLYQQALAPQLIAQIPLGNYYGAMFAFNDGEELILLQSGSGAWAALRCDNAGNWGTFADPNFISFYAEYSLEIYPLGNGQFLWPVAGGNTILLTVPRVKNGRMNYMSVPGFVFSNSCAGGSPNNTFIDPIGKYLAAEWIVPLGINDNFYSTIYSLDPYGGARIKTEGFVGNGSSDPFNQSAIASAPYLSNQYSISIGDLCFQQNGLAFQTNLTTVPSNEFQTAFSLNRINPGGSTGDCVTPNKSSVTNAFAIVVNGAAPGLITALNTQPLLYNGGTDLPYNGMAIASGKCVLLDILGNALLFTGLPGPNLYPTASLDKNGNFYWCVWSAPQGVINVYYQKVNLGPYADLAIPQPNSGLPMPFVNFSYPANNVLYRSTPNA